VDIPNTDGIGYCAYQLAVYDSFLIESIYNGDSFLLTNATGQWDTARLSDQNNATLNLTGINPNQHPLGSADGKILAPLTSFNLPFPRLEIVKDSSKSGCSAYSFTADFERFASWSIHKVKCERIPLSLAELSEKDVLTTEGFRKWGTSLPMVNPTGGFVMIDSFHNKIVYSSLGDAKIVMYKEMDELIQIEIQDDLSTVNPFYQWNLSCFSSKFSSLRSPLHYFV